MVWFGMRYGMVWVGFERVYEREKQAKTSARIQSRGERSRLDMAGAVCERGEKNSKEQRIEKTWREKQERERETGYREED